MASCLDFFESAFQYKNTEAPNEYAKQTSIATNRWGNSV